MPTAGRDATRPHHRQKKGRLKKGHTWHASLESTSRATSASRSHSPTSTASAVPAPRKLLAATGVSPDLRVHQLGDEELVKLRDEIDGRDFKIEGDLRREVQADIRRKIEIGSYQGRRHRQGLPVRGQRTKTNARTRKGPKRTVAGKKKAK